ncbi:MAG: MATE family efflux transporter [Clostridiales bacterium]|nr:MATE family efflux transporter [Clostridiales bacterium]
MGSALRRLYAPEYLLKPEKWMGEVLPAKDVYKSLSRVAWPATVEMVLISLMNLVDTIMVSSMGAFAVAATGLTQQPRMIFFSFFFALNAGVTAIVSRRKGEQDVAGANKCLSQAIMICVVLSGVLCALSFTVARPLLMFAGAQADTIEPAVIYFKITMVGMVFAAIGMVINAAQRGAGNTRISMWTNLIANVVNVVFNYLLINGIGVFPKWGVKGAGIATLMGNVASCLISIYSVSKPFEFLHIKVKSLFKFESDVIKPLLKISSSAALEQSFVRIGFFAYTKIVATLGTAALATHQICMSIINLSYSFGDGLGISAASLVGQNLGRRRPDIAMVYGKAAQRIGVLVSVGLIVLFTAGGRMIMGMFTNVEEIIDIGQKILLIVAFTAPGQISNVVFSGSLRGAGDTRFVAYSSLVSIAIVRPLVSYVLIFPLKLGLIGAWIGLFIDQHVRLAFSSYRFKKEKWQKIKL